MADSLVLFRALEGIGFFTREMQKWLIHWCYFGHW